MKQITGTVIVTFYGDMSEQEINSYLDKERVEGTKVSQFINRYAIEVPAGHEDEYVTKFTNAADMIESVNPHYLKGMRERPRPKKKEE